MIIQSSSILEQSNNTCSASKYATIQRGIPQSHHLTQSHSLGFFTVRSTKYYRQKTIRNEVEISHSTSYSHCLQSSHNTNLEVKDDTKSNNFQPDKQYILTNAALGSKTIAKTSGAESPQLWSSSIEHSEKQPPQNVREPHPGSIPAGDAPQDKLKLGTHDNSMTKDEQAEHKNGNPLAILYVRKMLNHFAIKPVDSRCVSLPAQTTDKTTKGNRQVYPPNCISPTTFVPSFSPVEILSVNDLVWRKRRDNRGMTELRPSHLDFTVSVTILEQIGCDSMGKAMNIYCRGDARLIIRESVLEKRIRVTGESAFKYSGKPHRSRSVITSDNHKWQGFVSFPCHPPNN